MTTAYRNILNVQKKNQLHKMSKSNIQFSHIKIYVTNFNWLETGKKAV